MKLMLQWNKSSTGSYYPLGSDFTPLGDMVGVYVIWKPGGPVIRVGQGNVAQRLSSHQNDGVVTMHGNDLVVTWAEVGQAHLDGVELFLAQQYKPTVGDRFPNCQPIEVNLLQ